MPFFMPAAHGFSIIFFFIIPGAQGLHGLPIIGLCAAHGLQGLPIIFFMPAAHGLHGLAVCACATAAPVAMTARETEAPAMPRASGTEATVEIQYLFMSRMISAPVLCCVLQEAGRHAGRAFLMQIILDECPNT